MAKQTITTYYFQYNKYKQRYYWTSGSQYDTPKAIDFNNKTHSNAMILGAYWASHDVLFKNIKKKSVGDMNCTSKIGHNFLEVQFFMS